MTSRERRAENNAQYERECEARWQAEADHHRAVRDYDAAFRALHAACRNAGIDLDSLRDYLESYPQYTV